MSYTEENTDSQDSHRVRGSLGASPNRERGSAESHPNVPATDVHIAPVIGTNEDMLMTRRGLCPKNVQILSASQHHQDRLPGSPLSAGHDC